MRYFKDNKNLRIDPPCVWLVSQYRYAQRSCPLAQRECYNLWLLVSGKLETFIWLHSYLTPRNDLQSNEIMSEKHSELLRERTQINARAPHYRPYILPNFLTSGKIIKLLLPYQQFFTQVARSCFPGRLWVYCSLWPQPTFIILRETKIENFK